MTRVEQPGSELGVKETGRLVPSILRYGIVDLANLKSQDIRTGDIVTSLSRQARYNGHTTLFYSVAQHLCICSDAAPVEARPWVLMHDFAEALIGDITRPVRTLLPETKFKDLEQKMDQVIWRRYGYEAPTPEVEAIIRDIDLRVMATEMRDLFDPPVESKFEPYQLIINPWQMDYAKDQLQMKIVKHLIQS